MSTSAPAASSAHDLFDRMRTAVLDLDLAPGEKLTERGLEAQFGASRTPVRSALLRLAGEGLVLRDGRGWRVTPIDITEVVALGELRLAIESAAVRLAVSRAEEVSLAELAAFVESSRPAHDEAEVVQAGSDFHVRLAQLSGNQPMADTVRGAMTRLARTRWLDVRSPETRELAWTEHRAVVDAVRARDADLAADLLAAHLRSGSERLVTVLTAERRRLRARGVSIV